MFYKPPIDLKDEDVDPLLRKAVAKINSSGWVWTAESCQGHPDAKGPPWADNVQPMLRLVTKKEDFPRMLGHLIESLEVPAREVEGWLWPETILACEMYPVSHGDWREVLVYVHARTAFDRDNGIIAFERFADAVSDNSFPDR